MRGFFRTGFEFFFGADCFFGTGLTVLGMDFVFFTCDGFFFGAGFDFFTVCGFFFDADFKAAGATLACFVFFAGMDFLFFPFIPR